MAQTETKTFWIVWNKGHCEGFVTDDEADARSSKSGKPTRTRGYVSASTVGMAFHEAYEDDKLTIQKVELSVPVSS